MDSADAGSSGFCRWTPGASRYPPAGSSYGADFTNISGDLGWIPNGVDSQKNRPDASEIARFASQHTKCTGRNHKNNDFTECGENFSGQAVGVCPVSNCRCSRVLSSPLDPELDSGWTPESSRLVPSPTPRASLPRFWRSDPILSRLPVSRRKVSRNPSWG